MRVAQNGGVKTNGVDLRAINKIDMQTLKYGIIYYSSSNYAKPVTKFKERTSTYAIYFEDAISFGDLRLRPGIRFEQSRLNSFGNNNMAKKYNFSGVTPAFGIDYQFGDSGFSSFANYARVFKAPDVIEALYASGRSDYASNDDLKATTGDSYELGTRYKISLSSDSHINLSAKYYETKYKNLIVDTFKKGSAIMRKNVGGADVSGVELSARAFVGDLSLSASYTHQKTKYKDRIASSTKDGINSYYRPDNLSYKDQGDKYTLNAEYGINSLDMLVGYNLVYFASKKTKSAGSDILASMPSYSVSDIYATYAPLGGRLKGLEINFGIYNLFNKAYASHSQRSEAFSGDSWSIDWEQGRNVKLNLSYKF